MLYVGVDHHKRFSYMKVVDESGRVKKEGRVDNTRAALRGFFRSLGSEPRKAVLEAGFNWTVMFDRLEDEGCIVTLAHPLKVKAIADAKIKTDRIDAGVLAQLLRCDLIPEAHVSSPAGREAKNILRYRAFLVRAQTMVKNRIHALLDRQADLPAALRQSDLFGGKGMALLCALKLRAPDRKLLDEHLALLDELRAHIATSDGWIREQFKRSRDAQRLATIPGIGTFFAVLIANEIDGIERFSSDSKLHIYIGIVPSTYASGDKVHHGRITKTGNRWLRWAFIEAVWPAIRQDKQLRELYDRIAQGRDANVAKLTVARRLATIAYRMLKEDRDYQVRDEHRR